jgi:uncharacterized protein
MVGKRSSVSLIFDIKVMPQSGRQELVLDKAGILKCFIKAAPEDGKANKELIQFIAKKLNVNKQDIEIIAGLTSRKKRLIIHMVLTYEQFLLRMGLEHQSSMFK